jgi:hypothetical protein
MTVVDKGMRIVVGMSRNRQDGEMKIILEA